MAVTLNDQDKLTVRTAAYGAISLLAAAGAAGGSPHKIATTGSIALASATGEVGRVLAEKRTGVNLDGKSVADIADQVLPALTASMELLAAQDEAEADNFRATVLVAVEAARQNQSGPTLVEMTVKITAALDAT
ncbi:hypothetical protein [Nocardia stercoris]|uniref:Uncharacterized protein n=1 Tax=Nocardia stercoris TaxID=2483361 RepID=A0A3M2L8J3_9NOCA|nr:hypothetical protein [Nocardia stercoris]RMI33010.1 hypothetical protein EBN03_12540 [Nocardia stercoris]